MISVVRVKRAYAGAVRAVGRPLVRVGAIGGSPPSRENRVGHWLRSLPGIYDVRALIDLDVPWWTYGAIDEVELWLASRSATRVLEFGSGASTIWLAKRASEVHSVEHDAEFAADVQTLLTGFSGVRLHVVPAEPSDAPQVASGKPGFEKLDFGSYVGTIDGFSESFDLIVIDGRARADCLAAAIPHLADDGIVVFDNSRRVRYRSAIASCGLGERRFVGLAPTLPYPEQTSLLRRALQES